MMSRRENRRGQALTEFALLAPVLLGFLALTLQGGIVISDQVNLEHYAYEGAQWAVANRTAATSGTISGHIQDQLCGSGVAIGSSSGLTRYCREGSLSITVAAASATAAVPGWRLPAGLAPVLDAEAANGCQSWDLSLSSATISVARGSTAALTTTLAGVGGSGSPSGAGSTPTVTLSSEGLPGYQANGTPLFNPPTVGTSSTLRIAPSANTPLGTYRVTISGIDQCGATPAGGEAVVQVTVTTGSAPGTVPTSVNLGLDGITPVCIPIGSPATLTLNGHGFAAGATVTVGSGATATTVAATVASPSQMAITVPAPSTAGVSDLTVNNADGTSTTLFNGLTVASSCAGVGGGNGTAAASTVCPFGGGVAGREFLVTLAWNERLVVPWLTNTVALTATQRGFCQ